MNQQAPTKEEKKQNTVMTWKYKLGINLVGESQKTRHMKENGESSAMKGVLLACFLLPST
jgi:hypothetical protein